MKNEYIILDFETTGLAPYNSRIIEVGAVRVNEKEIIDEFHTLMNPGRRISSFITHYTGITNEMVVGKPTPEEIMPDLNNFIKDSPVIAHNASFDKKFLYSEMNRVGIDMTSNDIICTLLLSRRLLQGSYSYSLPNLVNYLNIDKQNLNSHRALDDVIMTAQVWFYLVNVIKENTGVNEINPDLLKKLMRIKKSEINEFFLQLRN